MIRSLLGLVDTVIDEVAYHVSGRVMCLLGRHNGRYCRGRLDHTLIGTEVVKMPTDDWGDRSDDTVSGSTRRLGLPIPKPDPRDVQYGGMSVSPFDSDAETWQNEWPIYDQGDLGCSTAAAMMHSLQAYQHMPHWEPSVQEVMDSYWNVAYRQPWETAIMPASAEVSLADSVRKMIEVLKHPVYVAGPNWNVEIISESEDADTPEKRWGIWHVDANPGHIVLVGLMTTCAMCQATMNNDPSWQNAFGNYRYVGFEAAVWPPRAT